MKLFVYGTLMGSTGARPAYIKKHLMLNLGSFPGIIESESEEDIVRGEIIEVSEDDFDRLDSYEGYRKENPAGSLYLRKTKPVYTEDGELLEAEVYIYNQLHSDSSADIIKEGRWYGRQVRVV